MCSALFTDVLFPSLLGRYLRNSPLIKPEVQHTTACLWSCPAVGTLSAAGSPRQQLSIQSSTGDSEQGSPFNAAVIVAILDQYLPNGAPQWDAAAVGVPRGDSPERGLFPTRVCNGGALNCAHVGQVNDQLYLADGRRFCVGGQFNSRSDL